MQENIHIKRKEDISLMRNALNRIVDNLNVKTLKLTSQDLMICLGELIHSLQQEYYKALMCVCV